MTRATAAASPCGCGNFLSIPYRELRELEIEVLKEINPGKQLDALSETLSVVPFGSTLLAGCVDVPPMVD